MAEPLPQLDGLSLLPRLLLAGCFPVLCCRRSRSQRFPLASRLVALFRPLFQHFLELLLAEQAHELLVDGNHALVVGPTREEEAAIAA